MAGVTKKAGLILMIKKRLKLRAKRNTKPLLMAQGLFEAKQSPYRNYR